MMRRLVWLVLGAGLAYVLLRRVGAVKASPGDLAARAAKQVGVRAGQGATDRATGAIAAVRSFGSDVRAAAAEREAELRAAVAPMDDDEPRPTPRDL